MHFPSRSAKWELYTNHWLGFTSNARKTNDSTSCKDLFPPVPVLGCEAVKPYSQTATFSGSNTRGTCNLKQKQGKPLVSYVPSTAHDLGYFLEQTSQIRACSNHSRH